MKRFFLTQLLFAAFLSTATAQHFPIDTARLNNAYRALLQNPQSKELQLDFFRAFPENWNDFNSTYKYSDKKRIYNFFHDNILSSCVTFSSEYILAFFEFPSCLQQSSKSANSSPARGVATVRI